MNSIQSQRIVENVDIVIDEILKDEPTLNKLQYLYNEYDAEAERLRERYGCADFISDEWSDKSLRVLTDFVIFKSSVSDWYCDEENDNETYDFITELDLVIVERWLS